MPQNSYCRLRLNLDKTGMPTGIPGVNVRLWYYLRPVSLKKLKSPPSPLPYLSTCYQLHQIHHYLPSRPRYHPPSCQPLKTPSCRPSLEAGLACRPRWYPDRLSCSPVPKVGYYRSSRPSATFILEANYDWKFQYEWLERPIKEMPLTGRFCRRVSSVN